MTHCVPVKHFTAKSDRGEPLVYHAGIFSTAISSNSSNDTNQSDYSICKTQGAYCTKGYFGPVFQTVDVKPEGKSRFVDQYFISPVDRSSFTGISDIELEQSVDQEDASIQWNSYVVGLFDQSEVMHYSTQQQTSKAQALSAAQAKCPLASELLGKNQRVIKSLGTNIKAVALTKTGFTVKYNGGDECFYAQKKQNFTSEVRFVCDPDEDEGWPRQIENDETPNLSTDPSKLKAEQKCNVVFEWRTKHACRHCLSYEVTNVIGPCTWYQREITQTPNPTCQIYS